MATLTTNISNVSLTVSGTTTKSATISWTLPSVPSGGTINSCTLTGTATASMSKGSATIKVNGTTVSSGSNFSISLGTANTTSSVSATAVGGNKNAAGTVTLSNLVYTVDYTEPAVTYTVTFKDWDGTVLKTEEVGSGSSATAPEVSRYGYVLTGWSVDFSEVRSDIITVAQYEIANILTIKENGSWSNIDKVFKKISGVWVEQVNSSWNGLFNVNNKYVQKEIPLSPTAILYSDGTFIFSNFNDVDNSHGTVIATYTGWDTSYYGNAGNASWYDIRENIINVYYNATIMPLSCDYWFYDCSNLTSAYFGNLKGELVYMRGMFQSCENLSFVDLSNAGITSEAEDLLAFRYCNNVTIYVKDETAKAAIESSMGFPSTATVIIGKPN